jgi:polysaccharide pyruvyl transferase WcaK-like protein
MPAALIAGAFGQDNPGDEALLDVAVAAVRARPGWEPVVATARPGDTAARLGLEAVPASDVVTAWAAARADALVVGGGTIFKALHSSSGRSTSSLLRRAAAVTASFRARGKPVALLGVGAAEVHRPSQRRLVRAIARHADLLVLRDHESAHLLASMGVSAPVRVGADLAWLATEPRASEVRAPHAPVGVAVSHLAGDEPLTGNITRALGSIADAGHVLEVEPWQGSPRLGRDARLARRIVASLHPAAALLAPPRDLAEAIDRTARRSVVLAVRFHAALAAAIAGTPFVAVAHEPKLQAIARRMDQLAVRRDATDQAIAESLTRALRGPAPSRAAIDAERRRAQATVDLLGLLLEGGGSVDGLEHLDLVPEPAAT